MPNPNHDERGRFSSGSAAAAARGDNLAAQPSNKGMRNVPGHGVVPRSRVVAKHRGPSVGTGGSGGAGDGSGGGLMSAREERVHLNKNLDERHFPKRSNADVAAATDLSKPIQSITATLGVFDAREMGRKLIGG